MIEHARLDDVLPELRGLEWSLLKAGKIRCRAHTACAHEPEKGRRSRCEATAERQQFAP